MYVLNIKITLYCYFINSIYYTQSFITPVQKVVNDFVLSGSSCAIYVKVESSNLCF